MKITNVKVTHVAIPLEKSYGYATGKLLAREYVLVQVETDAGVVGEGYTFCIVEGSGIKYLIERYLAPLVAGADPLAHEMLWEKMFRANYFDFGRNGALMRGISAIDIALWDVKCKVANLPLSRLLGTCRTRIPAYASGGGYYEGDSTRLLAEEMAGCVEAGFKAVKMKIGRGAPAEDLERVKAVREAIGPDTELMVDAVNGWKDAKHAIKVARMIEPYDIRWFEEPVMPDNIPALAEIAAAIDIPVAGCEFEAGRWAYRNFVLHKAFDILMPDVNCVGGISEWLKIAGMAACFEVPVSPHRGSEIHAQLAGATQGVFIIEYQAPVQSSTVVFDRILREPLVCRDGIVEIPQTPGVGMAFDWKAVERYRV